LLEMLEMQALQPDGRQQANVTSLIPDENRSAGPRGNSPLALAPAVSYVESGFREKVSSGEAAERCGLTSFQFSRVFKETYGFTFQDYVNRYRIREACRLLRNPAAEVSEVSFLVGFNDVSYFGKTFKRYMHCSPSQFAAANEDALDAGRLSEDLELETRLRGQ
jgi:AraC-like DNA-binding protein